MLVQESSERYDQKQNWVRYKLFNDNFTLFEFEGYTIKNKQVSGLFDRKLVKDISLLNFEPKNIQISCKIARHTPAYYYD